MMPDDRVDIDAVLAAQPTSGHAWREDAACRAMRTEEFFAEVPSADVRRACRSCPVRLACLADEVGRPPEEVCGFRGGMSEAARRRLLAEVARRRPIDGRGERAAARRAFDAGATPAAVASRFGVSVRTAYRWRSDSQRRAS